MINRRILNFICFNFIYYLLQLFLTLSISLYFLLLYILYPIQFEFYSASVILFIYEPCIHMDVLRAYINIFYV